jgi:phosphoserine phosphatase RsbX
MEALIDWGLALKALKGQKISGDDYVVEPHEDGFLAAAIDGLGHGGEAAAAAQIAASILRANARDPAVQLLHRCHEGLKLKQARGVAMSLASFNKPLKLLSWLGVGNVEGALFHLDATGELSYKSILPRGGVVGYQMPSLRPTTASLDSSDTIIFATDGIRSGFVKGVTLSSLSMTPQQLADHIMAEYDKSTDDSLVLVVRYLGGQL